MKKLSKEYAVSLFSIALEDQKEEQYFEELRSVVSLLDESPEYYELLSSPELSREERVSLLASSFGGALSEYVLSFLKLLCEAAAFKLLPECAAEYEKLLRAHNRTEEVKVTSSVALTDEEKEKIKERAERLEKRRCEMRFFVDPSILGGVIIETESSVIDGSLRKSLQEIKEVIKK